MVRTDPAWAHLKRAVRVRINHRGEGEMLRREAFFEAAQALTPYLGVEREGYRLIVPTDDAVVGKITFVRETFGLDDLRTAVVAIGTLRPSGFSLAGGVFVDIGANIGTTSIPAAVALGAQRVVAFEPAPRNAALLRQNAAANDLGGRVTVVECALSDREGTAELSLSSTNSGDHHLLTNGRRREGTSTVNVPVQTLDHHLRRLRIEASDVALIWMDAQGHEGAIFSGASGILAERAVPVVTEFWPAGLAAASQLESMVESIQAWFTAYVDLSTYHTGGPATPVPVTTLRSLTDALRGPDAHTNLLLLP